MDNALTDIDINEWVIVKTDGPQGFLGRHLHVSCDDVERKFEYNRSIKLSPCISYMIIDRPMQHKTTGQVMLQRDPMVSPFELFSSDVTVRVRGCALVLLAYVKPRDQDKYKRLILDAFETMSRMRAQEAGIELATQLPTSGLVRG